VAVLELNSGFTPPNGVVPKVN